MKYSANYDEIPEISDIENTHVPFFSETYINEKYDEEPVTFNAIAHKDDILQFYLKDIGKFKLLKAEEEKELGKIINLRLDQSCFQ